MRVAQFLSVLRPWKHTIYLSRHGESTYNVEKKLGGDPALSPAGDEYARRLGEYSEQCIQINPHTGERVAARLWTSSLQRTALTAAYIPQPELDASQLAARTNTLDEFIGWKQMRHRVYRNLDEICTLPPPPTASRAPPTHAPLTACLRIGHLCMSCSCACLSSERVRWLWRQTRARMTA
jgi:hypothetical protein